MDTSVGGFIYEDQFLQISSKTASMYMFGLGEAEHPNFLLDFFWTTQSIFANGNRVEVRDCLKLKLIFPLSIFHLVTF